MIEKSIIIEIEKLLDNKKIIDSKLLSDSFGINCLKIVNEDNKKFIIVTQLCAECAQILYKLLIN